MFGLAFTSKLLLAASAAAALATVTVPAAANAGELQQRFHRQQQRIDQGVANGQLTRAEYGRDESRLNRVEGERKRDLRVNDGHLTAGERSQLNRQLNRDSRGIYYTKHNRSDQPGV